MFDKWAHIGIFCLMTFLFCWGIFKRGTSEFELKKNFIQIAMSCLLYGILMELVQRYFIPNRSFANAKFSPVIPLETTVKL
jgi:VanZ family protein